MSVFDRKKASEALAKYEAFEAELADVHKEFNALPKFIPLCIRDGYVEGEELTRELRPDEIDSHKEERKVITDRMREVSQQKAEVFVANVFLIQVGQLMRPEDQDQVDKMYESWREEGGAEAELKNEIAKLEKKEQEK